MMNVSNSSKKREKKEGDWHEFNKLYKGNNIIINGYIDQKIYWRK